MTQEERRQQVAAIRISTVRRKDLLIDLPILEQKEGRIFRGTDKQEYPKSFWQNPTSLLTASSNVRMIICGVSSGLRSPGILVASVEQKQSGRVQLERLHLSGAFGSCSGSHLVEKENFGYFLMSGKKWQIQLFTKIHHSHLGSRPSHHRTALCSGICDLHRPADQGDKLVCRCSEEVLVWKHLDRENFLLSCK